MKTPNQKQNRMCTFCSCGVCELFVVYLLLLPQECPTQANRTRVRVHGYFIKLSMFPQSIIRGLPFQLNFVFPLGAVDLKAHTNWQTRFNKIIFPEFSFFRHRIPYFETSAATGDNVEEAVSLILERIMKRMIEMQQEEEDSDTKPSTSSTSRSLDLNEAVSCEGGSDGFKKRPTCPC